MFDYRINTIFLDSDGVMADFDKRAAEIFGMTAEKFEYQYGPEIFWNTLRSADPHFFRNLDWMPDAMELYNAVKHLKHAILTGIPKEGVDAHSNDKIDFYKYKLDPNLRVYCCQASKKWTFCQKGDILIDDRFRYSKKWENAGGTFIHHKSADQSLEKLRDMRVI